MYKFLWGVCFLFLECLPRNEIPWVYGNSVPNFLRNYKTVSQRGCAILYSSNECMRVTTSLIFLLFILNYYDHPSGCEVVVFFFCNFDLHFPNA